MPQTILALNVKVGQTIETQYNGTLTITFKRKSRQYMGYMAIQGTRPTGEFGAVDIKCNETVIVK